MGDISDQLEALHGHTLGTDGFEDHQNTRGAKYVALHFLGKHGEELLHVQDQSVDKDPLVFALMGSYPGDPKLRWYGQNEFYQRDYGIVGIKGFYEHYPRRRGLDTVRVERVKITFANGEQRTFSATGGFPRGYCRSKQDRDALSKDMNHDRAGRLYRRYYHNQNSTAGQPQGFEPCICQRPGYYSGLPGGACENCMNEGMVPVHTSNKGNIEMNTQEMLTIIQLEGGAKVVRAKYLEGGSGAYCFKNVVGLNLKAGDMVVCETRDTFALLEVTDPDVMATDVGCALHDLKHVVAKVRNDDYVAAKESEAMAHRQLALSEVTARLSTYRAQIGDKTFNSVAAMLGHTEVDDAEVVDAGDAGSAAYS